ncbi:MAG: nickel pincer cofactor biosynthesis protein LarC [Opitutaceae bacterium]|nr:nickel pincer cofactor biosynthesis protein LarC [Opitutaceae bacterium]
MSILRIEPFSGVSGDLFAGALAQLADGESLVSELPMCLGLDGVETIWETVNKCGVSCRKVSFVERPEASPKSGHGAHRHLSDIQVLIKNADIPESAKDRALDIFQTLAEAEADVHGISLEKVHFHEVGAVDSILDIVASALLLDRLDVTSAICDPVVTGKGFVAMAHGRYPIPAPATQKLLQGMVVEPGLETAELTTPTGAAILRHLKPSFSVPQLRILSTAVAGATKDFAHPNVLRLSLCESMDRTGELLLIQTNIDDMSGELLGSDLLDMLLEAGAKDAWIGSIVMKRGRPAFKLEALCAQSEKDKVSVVILENTSTIGLRYLPVTRRELERSSTVMDTEWGRVAAKEVVLPSGEIRITPEYASCLKIAQEAGLSVSKVYQSALSGLQ